MSVRVYREISRGFSRSWGKSKKSPRVLYSDRDENNLSTTEIPLRKSRLRLARAFLRAWTCNRRAILARTDVVGHQEQDSVGESTR